QGRKVSVTRVSSSLPYRRAREHSGPILTWHGPLAGFMKLSCLTSIFIIVLASCSAPISYRETEKPTLTGTFTEHPLDLALSRLEAGKTASDPRVASGHFVTAARLAGDKALRGEPGALALY